MRWSSDSVEGGVRVPGRHDPTIGDTRRGVGAPSVGDEAADDRADEIAESVGDRDEVTDDEPKSKKSRCTGTGAESPSDDAACDAFRWNR